jgi:S1-C subfamily serine protease
VREGGRLPGAVTRVLVGRLLTGLLLPAGQLAAQESPTFTSTVFTRYSDRVVKIQVVESGSAAKAGIGSGFFVSDGGHIVTNYHVIADLVHHPERYRAELADTTSATEALTILAIDVVHDLAVVRADRPSPRYFPLRPATARQGDRLYALGHPSDLGLSIVEGTHNGLLRHTLYPKVHFTGSLNPGMSGGPAISADGRVIGVNVSTFGEQLSFLVPVERAIDLMRVVLAPGYQPPAAFLEEVGRQLTAYQDVYLNDLFAAPTQTVELGPYRVVTEPAPFFRCWGDADQPKDLPYAWADHECSTDDYVYIASEQESGVVELTHELISTTSLSAPRFFALYTDTFGHDNTPGGDEEHVTSWRCGTRNVRNAAAPLRAVLCLRRYRKLGELYDAVLKIAVLGRRDAGLVSTLILSGATFANITLLTGRYLDVITWR